MALPTERHKLILRTQEEMLHVEALGRRPEVGEAVRVGDLDIQLAGNKADMTISITLRNRERGA